MDEDNIEFLKQENLSQVPDIRLAPGSNVISVDHRSIEAHILQEQDPNMGNPEMKDIAFVGRSNVGKSSLINSMLGVQAAQTSKTPGKTRDLTFY